MLKYLPYMLKTLWRHRTRTALTVVGAAIAMFIFCFVGSVQQGLDSLSQQREASRRSEEHTSEPQSQAEPVCRLPPEKKKNN